MSCHIRQQSHILFVALLLMASDGARAGEVTHLQFSEPPDTSSETVSTLQSLIRVQGKVGLQQDGLYLLTHYGDRAELFQRENQRAIDHPLIDQTWRYCSVFSSASQNGVVMGRNWDNQNVGSIIINLYQPSTGYSSISFTRAMDMGFPLNLDLEDFRWSDKGSRLLLAPFYAFDGINEHGLAVAVAGVRQTNHKPEDGKELVFVPYLVRRILDQAKTTAEAVELVANLVPFDLDAGSLNTHFFVVDSAGKSVVLEYAQDRWHAVFGEKPWQVLTNKPVHDVPDADLRDQCWRYRAIAETLEQTEGQLDWHMGMKILQDVAQKGTTWSVVYAPTTRELYLSVYQKWDRVYHLTIP